MVSVKIQDKLAFRVIGVKTWIPDTDNAAFGKFWRQCHADGAVADLRKFCKDRQTSQTQSAILGLSCTEKDPDCQEL